MTRAFSKEERDNIRNELIEQGKILFKQWGFQKTSISEITKKVGIAQGTFYHFFSSKEALYFTILEQEEMNIRNRLLQINLDNDATINPKKRFQKLLKEIVHIVETNELIRGIYASDSLRKVINRLTPETLENHFLNDTKAVKKLMERWQEYGINLRVDARKFAAILRALFMLTFHKEEIGHLIYRETIDDIIDMVADGLFQEDG